MCFDTAEAASSQRLSKLLQGKAKPKQASQPSQQQAAPAITPAMRDHASTRLSTALSGNSALSLEGTQAESAAASWESAIFQSSGSKSAYLSKLANTVSQIKRASDVMQLDALHLAFQPAQATTPALPTQQARSQSGASPNRIEIVKGEPTPDRHWQKKSMQKQLAQADAQQQDVSELQPVSESELSRLMQLVSGKRCAMVAVLLAMAYNMYADQPGLFTAVYASQSIKTFP